MSGPKPKRGLTLAAITENPSRNITKDIVDLLNKGEGRALAALSQEVIKSFWKINNMISGLFKPRLHEAAGEYTSVI